MKQVNSLIKYSAIGVSALAAVSTQASTDYGPAIWHPICNANWYTTGNGHIFNVIHDMEGYYASTVAYFDNCSMTSASIHYAVNGKSDATSDAPAGEITQLGVRESQYAWHALCWNTWAWGTEHEGFASNPAWYTTAMYNASGDLQKHLLTVSGKPKDRNHVIGHDQKRISAWVTWVNANYAMNPTCNTHTDPGLSWDWTYFMNRINGTVTTVTVDNSSANFSASANWATGTSATDKNGADYRYRSTAAVSDAAVFNASFGSAGSHTVSVWYPEGANRSTTTPYIISTSAGDHTEPVNQQITGGQWVSQGAYSMNSGANYVKVSCWTGTGFVVVADAVKWQ